MQQIYQQKNMKWPQEMGGQMDMNQMQLMQQMQGGDQKPAMPGMQMQPEGQQN